MTPYGPAFHVWAQIHEDVPELPFLIDTGAGVSMIPAEWYHAIPEEDRPELEQPLSDVYS